MAHSKCMRGIINKYFEIHSANKRIESPKCGDGGNGEEGRGGVILCYVCITDLACKRCPAE